MDKSGITKFSVDGRTWYVKYSRNSERWEISEGQWQIPLATFREDRTLKMFLKANDAVIDY